VKGEAVVELEPLVTTLQNIGAKRPPLVVLHLKDLSFISSLAMGVMLAFRRSVLAGGGKVKVAAMQPLVLDSFKRARLDKVFEIHETLDGAMSV
jgi:anti-anti-sigma factor